MVLALVVAALLQAGTIIDGPPPPVAPDVFARDAATGKTTIRAIKLREPLHVDGRLDDEVYQREPSFEGLVQAVPRYNAPVSERTEMWVMYDDENVYVACRCWDSAPREGWVSNELRRDTNQLRQNENFGVSFDTFYDRRNAFVFYTNPLGARADYSVVDEGAPNTDWNPVWEAKTAYFDGGWTVEMKIPFKSLRYRSGSDQVWGLQLRRSIRHKNEWAYLTPVPQNLAGPQAFNRISAGATLVGLDLPPAGRNLELKPYAISRLTTDRLRTPPTSNDLTGDLGGDVKYGITANVTADFTYNTDFAQVEIDEQQVNLTRFSLFFPEKRDFFLEGRGIFDFGRGGVSSGFAQSVTTTAVPYLFYSRRIGLNRNRIIPIQAGGRLTGKVGPYAIGVMNIETGSEEVSATDPTNFTVVRVKRDVLRRSSVGVMATNRSVGATQSGSNQAYGVDAAFSFFENVGLGAYYARTDTPGLSGSAESYQGLFDYGADRYGAHLEYVKVGDAFNPEVGFVSRRNFGRTYATARFSPRPTRIRSVRKFTWQGNFEQFVSGDGTVETEIESAQFTTEFENSDGFALSAQRELEVLPAAVPIAGVAFGAGSYRFSNATVSYTLGAQRRVSGAMSLQVGQFYDGTITSVAYTTGGVAPARVAILKQFSVEPSIQVNRVDARSGSFTTTLLRSRADYGFSPLTFLSALLQFNSADKSFSSNLRYRWEYRPGSELFVVYTDERDLTDPLRAAPTLVTGLRNRAFVIKINRLLRF